MEKKSEGKRLTLQVREWEWDFLLQKERFFLFLLFFLVRVLFLQMKQEIECGRYHHHHNSILFNFSNPKTRQNKNEILTAKMPTRLLCLDPPLTAFFLVACFFHHFYFYWKNYLNGDRGMKRNEILQCRHSPGVVNLLMLSGGKLGTTWEWGDWGVIIAVNQLVMFHALSLGPCFFVGGAICLGPMSKTRGLDQLYVMIIQEIFTRFQLNSCTNLCY